MLAGSRKPIGYLPLYTLKHLMLCDPQDVASEARASGLTATQFGPDKCSINSGALYVSHREALAALLQARGDVLVANGLPVDPDHFVTCQRWPIGAVALDRVTTAAMEGATDKRGFRQRLRVLGAAADGSDWRLRSRRYRECP
jgi:hypothetical protein